MWLFRSRRDWINFVEGWASNLGSSGQRKGNQIRWFIQVYESYNSVTCVLILSQNTECSVLAPQSRPNVWDTASGGWSKWSVIWVIVCDVSTSYRDVILRSVTLCDEFGYKVNSNIPHRTFYTSQTHLNKFPPKVHYPFHSTRLFRVSHPWPLLTKQKPCRTPSAHPT